MKSVFYRVHWMWYTVFFMKMMQSRNIWKKHIKQNCLKGELSKCKLDSIDSELGLTYSFCKHSKKLPEFINVGNTLRSSATISFSRMTLLLIYSIFQYLVSRVVCKKFGSQINWNFFRLAVNKKRARRGHNLANSKVCCNLSILLHSQTHFLNRYAELFKLLLYTFYGLE